MTNSSNTGVIKFKFNLKMSSPINEEHFLELEKWRTIFHKMGIIGEYQTTKVGFGNLSRRLLDGDGAFIITGAQTGGYPHLSGMQYTKVTKCILNKLSIEAIGPIAPDSQSLTHHAIYEKNAQINFIFFIHNINLWNYMIKNNLEQTPQEIDHKSHLFQQEALNCIQSKKSGIMAVSDLEGGIIAYADSAEHAGKIILDSLKESRK